MKTAKELIQRRIKIAEWLPRYTKADVVADFVAGVTVGLTMMPQSIAYAALAGLPAQYGLYTAFIGSFTYVFFGSIKEVSIGPTSLMAILTFSYTRGLPVEYVILLTFLVGWVELLMGVLKLGFLVEFISPCVTSGFTSATSLVIISTQIKGFLGINIKSHGFFGVLFEMSTKMGRIKISDTTLALACMIMLFGFKQLTKIPTKNITVKRILWFLSISKNALVVILTSFAGFYLHEYHGGSPFILSGNVPSGLPHIQPPSFSVSVGNGTDTVNFFGMVKTLGSGIIVIPVVAVLANIAIAKSFASTVVVDASQEMMTLGLCNIFGSFLQAMPSCGAFTRSAVASNSGVKTPLQGIYSGTIIILALSFLTPYFYYIPKATLAAVLVFAVMTLIDYQIFPKLWRVNKFDFWITLITLLTGLAFGADVGIIVGSIINVADLLKIWARPSIMVDSHSDENGDEYMYIKPDFGLHYPAIDYLSQEILKAHLKAKHLPLALDCSRIISIDYAGAQALNHLIDTYNKKSVRLMVLNVHPRVFKCLQQVLDIDNLYLCQCSENICEEFTKTTGQVCSAADTELSSLIVNDAKDSFIVNDGKDSFIVNDSKDQTDMRRRLSGSRKSSYDNV